MQPFMAPVAIGQLLLAACAGIPIGWEYCTGLFRAGHPPAPAARAAAVSGYFRDLVAQLTSQPPDWPHVNRRDDGGDFGRRR